MAFDVICGDFNFDNCSSGEAGLLPTRVSSSGEAVGSVTARQTSLPAQRIPAPRERVGGVFSKTDFSAPWKS